MFDLLHYRILTEVVVVDIPGLREDAEPPTPSRTMSEASSMAGPQDTTAALQGTRAHGQGTRYTDSLSTLGSAPIAATH